MFRREFFLGLPLIGFLFGRQAKANTPKLKYLKPGKIRPLMRYVRVESPSDMVAAPPLPVSVGMNVDVVIGDYRLQFRNGILVRILNDRPERPDA